MKKAMILAAGLGKRLRPITDSVPKPLVPVGGRTMLDRSLDLAVEAGVDYVTLGNNHTNDYLAAGLASTLEALDNAARHGRASRPRHRRGQGARQCADRRS